MQHGEVQIVADLARVDLTLTITNGEEVPLEWAQTYAIDPTCEVIGASLHRSGVKPIVARTLSLPDALRIERTARDRLSIIVFPVAQDETVRVELTFVTPLAGRGSIRVYRDVLGGEDIATPDTAEWIVEAGALVLDDEPVGMVLDSECDDGRLCFSGVARTGADSERPSIQFLVPNPEPKALSVAGGSFGATDQPLPVTARVRLGQGRRQA